jgi:hypothetical protein
MAYQLRHKWRNGATHVVFEPLDLIAKLAALVPPPRFNLVRYHGVFSANARWRSQIVPYDPGESDSMPHSGCNAEKEEKKAGGKNDLMPGRCHPRSYSWSELLRRVFEVDILNAIDAAVA